jgi:hypothetical protein
MAATVAFVGVVIGLSVGLLLLKKRRKAINQDKPDVRGKSIN